jgi:hypothetical protein
MYRLRDGLRCLSRPRIRACGFAIAPAPDGQVGSVGVVVDDEGKARYTGLIHCGSIWECPCCSMTVRAARAAEVTYAVESHGIKRCAMLTLTIRHDFAIGHDLKRVRQALANIWRRTTRGAPWGRFKDRVGLWHSIRAIEVTYGERNGWHPHLHVLLLLRNEIPAEEWDAESNRWSPSGANGARWLAERWGDMVENELGVHARPDEDHGCMLSPCHSSDYIAKLGLELSDPGVKRGRHHSRTPLEIAHDFCQHGRRRDAGLWQAYAAAMKGARFLTWSLGCKLALGIKDTDDLELANHEEDASKDRTVATIKAYAWCAIRGRVIDTPEGPCAACYWILEQAEAGGTEALNRALLQVATGEVGREEQRTKSA